MAAAGMGCEYLAIDRVAEVTKKMLAWRVCSAPAGASAAGSDRPRETNVGFEYTKRGTLHMQTP